MNIYTAMKSNTCSSFCSFTPRGNALHSLKPLIVTLVCCSNWAFIQTCISWKVAHCISKENYIHFKLQSVPNNQEQAAVLICSKDSDRKHTERKRGKHCSFWKFIIKLQHLGLWTNINAESMSAHVAFSQCKITVSVKRWKKPTLFLNRSVFYCHIWITSHIWDENLSLEF